MVKSKFTILPFAESHQHWAGELLEKEWGSTWVVSRGILHQALDLPGFVATEDGHPLGLATYHIAGEECELVTINSLKQGEGIGQALVQAVKQTALDRACRRLWLITTNDNMEALRFYQRQGFLLAALYRDALQVSRQLKPQIPQVGKYGIPLRDEIELEMILSPD